MSLVHVASAALLGTGIGVFYAARAVKEATAPKEIAVWATSLLALAVAIVAWLLLVATILGGPHQFLLPSLESPAERRFLMFYCFISGALGSLVTAGIAYVISRVSKA